MRSILQKARGREALKFQLEVIPFFVGDIPSGTDRVLFAWERGTKLFVTEAEKVNSKTRAVFFKQYLRQTATFYKDGNHFVPKEFSFKIQSVNGDGIKDRKTIGKCKVDMAEFCTTSAEPQPQDVFLQLKPVGKLKVSVKATWLSGAQIDPDAMTEITEMTEQTGRSRPRHRSEYGYEDEYGDEQDLSGFDHASAAGSVYDERGDEDGRERRRRRRKEEQRRTLPDEIPEGFELPPDPDEVARLRRERQMEEAAALEEWRRQQEEEQAQLRMQAGARVHTPTWRDYLCCCLPQQPQVLDPQETETMLSKQQDLSSGPPKKKKKKKKKKYSQLPEDKYGGDDGVGGERNGGYEGGGGGRGGGREAGRARYDDGYGDDHYDRQDYQGR